MNVIRYALAAQRRAAAALLLGSVLALSSSMASADVLPRAHLAFDGLAFGLGDASERDADERATGLRVRVGVEFPGPGYRSHALGLHRSLHRGPGKRSRGTRHRRSRAPLPVLGPRLGLEMHAAFASGDRDAARRPVDVALLGGYLTGRVPLGRVLSLKGLAGLASVAVDRADAAADADERRSGFGYGVGLEVALGRYTGLSLDWMRYLGDRSTEEGGVERLSALGAGFKWRF